MGRARANDLILYDRGYPAFWLVVRTKKNLRYCRCETYRPSDKAAGVCSGQLIRLTGTQTAATYPGRLCRISFFNQARDKRFVFLTNHLALPAATIAEIYRQRWQVELFFKWIKQHLKIKSFYGQSANAVKIQIWIAISTYLLIAIAKQGMALTRAEPPHFIAHFGVNLFEQRHIKQVVMNSLQQNPQPHISNQLNLFDF